MQRRLTGFLVSLFSSFLWVPASSAGINDCTEYVARALSQIDMACGQSGGRWTTSASQHMNWCVSASPQARANENNARLSALGLNGCRHDAGRKSIGPLPSGGHSPPLSPAERHRQACVVYAWRAMAQQDVAKRMNGWWPGTHGFHGCLAPIMAAVGCHFSMSTSIGVRHNSDRIGRA
jgi:hypothetical protein